MEETEAWGTQGDNPGLLHLVGTWGLVLTLLFTWGKKWPLAILWSHGTLFLFLNIVG